MQTLTLNFSKALAARLPWLTAAAGVLLLTLALWLLHHELGQTHLADVHQALSRCRPRHWGLRCWAPR